jgi:hypothetical protein
LRGWIESATDSGRCSARDERRSGLMSKTRDDLLMVLQHAYGMELEVPFKGISGTRRYRFDAADRERRVAVEYQGIGRGHQWASEQAKDWEKLNEATLCGWTVILCSAEMVNNGRCREYIDRALGHWQAVEGGR